MRLVDEVRQLRNKSVVTLSEKYKAAVTEKLRDAARAGRSSLDSEIGTWSEEKIEAVRVWLEGEGFTVTVWEDGDMPIMSVEF